MLESTYQSKLIKKIQALFPGCFIMRNDPTRNQGIPDLLILFRDTWAMLEIKVDFDSPHEPNQDYYVDVFNNMSFAAFIHPGIEEEVLSELQSAFWVTR